jgi:hypothetical protein
MATVKESNHLTGLWLNTRQVANMARCSPEVVRKACHKGELKIAKRPYWWPFKIDWNSAASWVESRKK